MDEWPLRRLNLFAIPAAVLVAVFSDSFWWYSLLAAGVGFVVAGVMAVLYLRKLRSRIEQANPLSRLSADLQGASDSSLHLRFTLMQSLSGAIITTIWYAIASAVARLFA